MDFEINSANPVVRAVVGGTAPRPAQLAAARGILPLPQSDLLEVLVALSRNDDAELAQCAQTTLAAQDLRELENTVRSNEIAPQVLAYFAGRENLPAEIQETILSNPKTPSTAIIQFARQTKKGDLLELISLNQQLLIRSPQIIDAIIANPYRTAEAERRAAEVKREFFEKSRGAQQIANELRAQGKTAAAEFLEQAEFGATLQPTSTASILSFDDAILLAEFDRVHKNVDFNR